MMSVPLVRDPEEKDLSSKDSENEDSREDSSGSMKSVMESTPGYHSFAMTRGPEDSEKEKKSPKEYKEYEFDSDGKTKSRFAPQKQASPLVIQWLQENYEGSDGTSLPRSTLYAHYKSFSDAMKLDPMNPASFGKLIRSIFPNLKTRRLGTRGHSKYHYYGIRIKATSELRLPSFSSSDQMLVQNIKPKARLKSDYDPEKSLRVDDAPGLYELNGQHMTTGATNVQLPEFVVPDLKFVLPPDLSMDHVHAFFSNYRQHCQNLVDVVFKHHFLDAEKYLQHYWHSLPPQFCMLPSIPEIVEQICEKDQLTYKAMATVLLPNVLQALPVSIPQGIRQFAKQLEGWVANSIEGMPPTFVSRKMAIVKKFSQSLHKQASLNHLTQAARAVLQNTTQVSQMIIDWNRLDFDFIKDQASWICQCGDDLIQTAQDDFKRFLTDRVSLEQWATWLQEIVNKIIGKCMDPRELVQLSRQLLLNWSYYSTLIIRDLTIRNASSFGSFHLLRTLFDEYIFYLIETKFASLIDNTQPFAPRGMLQQPHLLHHPHHQVTSQQGTSASGSSTGGHPGDTFSGGHSGMESYSLESLLNKETGRMTNHLPYPFQQDTSGVSEKQGQGGPGTGEEDTYAHMLHGTDLLHLNVQPYAPQQYSTTLQRGQAVVTPGYGNGLSAYGIPTQKSLDHELRLGQMVGNSSSGLDRLTPPIRGPPLMDQHGTSGSNKQGRPIELMAPGKPTNVMTYSFGTNPPTQINYHTINVDPSQQPQLQMRGGPAPPQQGQQYANSFETLIHAQPATQLHYREPDPKKMRIESSQVK